MPAGVLQIDLGSLMTFPKPNCIKQLFSNHKTMHCILTRSMNENATHYIIAYIFLDNLTS